MEGEIELGAPCVASWCARVGREYVVYVNFKKAGSNKSHYDILALLMYGGEVSAFSTFKMSNLFGKAIGGVINPSAVNNKRREVVETKTAF